jgi:hypothetical protein
MAANLKGEQRMSAWFSKWRGTSIKTFMATALVVTSLVAVATLASAHPGSSNASPAVQQLKGAVSTKVAAHGVFDATNAPTVSTSSISAPKTLPTNRALPDAQKAQAKGMTPGVIHATPSQAPAKASGTSANFVFGGQVPALITDHEGLNSTDGGGWFPPDQAIAVGGGGVFSNQYVLEGVNNAVAVYNTNYGLVSGPFSSDTVFASVKIPGDFFSDPQITYSASRTHWIITYLELTPGTAGNEVNHGYIDIAVSKTITPTGIPASYNVYRFDIGLNSNTEWCDYDTLGMEYWNLYVTCATYSLPGAFLGNRTFMFNQSDLYAGSGSPHWGWFFSVTNDLSCTGSPCPVYRLAPATEDGVAQEEWVLGTDAGYLGTSTTSTNLTLFAITNQNALASGSLPTGTFINGALPGAYSDPPGAAQPGTGVALYTGRGIKQFRYSGGHLWFSFSTGVTTNALHAGVYWASVEPFLSTLAAHTPQWVSGFNNHQQGYIAYNGHDAFLPSIQPGQEGDASLIYNYSGSDVFPSIVFTGKQNSDALGTMGQGLTVFEVSGSASNDSGRWGDYSACALNVNPTTRGYAFCAGEYGGDHTALGGSGWNTRMFTLRME